MWSFESTLVKIQCSWWIQMWNGRKFNDLPCTRGQKDHAPHKQYEIKMRTADWVWTSANARPDARFNNAVWLVFHTHAATHFIIIYSLTCSVLLSLPQSLLCPFFFRRESSIAKFQLVWIKRELAKAAINAHCSAAWKSIFMCIKECVQRLE